MYLYCTEDVNINTKILVITERAPTAIKSFHLYGI